MKRLAPVVVIAVAAVVVAACGSHPVHAHKTAAAAFVSDMRSKFRVLVADAQDSDLAAFGRQICQALSSGTSVTSEIPFAERTWTYSSSAPAPTAQDAVSIIGLANRDICPSVPAMRQYVAVNAAVSTECARFQAVNSQIEANTASDHTVADLVGTLSTDSITWAHALSRASNAADAKGVPAGHNKARALAVRIDQAALAIDNLALVAAVGKYGKVPAMWGAVTRSLDAVTMQCP